MKPNLLLALLLTIAPAAFSATLYVNAASTNAVAPYTNWLTAAAVIQDAIDASASGDEVVVTNGLYVTGGRPLAGYPLMTNRVTVDRAITLRSVNGPDVTVIEGLKVAGTNNGCGDGAIRCVYLASGAVLSGFTLTNGATRKLGDGYQERSGGGVFCESAPATVTNSILTGCSSSSYGGGMQGGVPFAEAVHCRFTGNITLGSGGAAHFSIVNQCSFEGNSAQNSGGGLSVGTGTNCTFTGNSANLGGGASSSTLVNCTARGNSAADLAGGAYSCTLANCILYYNTATQHNEPNYSGLRITNCCTTPMPSSGTGNITNEPAFVDLAGGNLRLQAGSPCINVGNNAYVTNSTDLDGRPRIVGGTVDMGAYEYQAPGMGEFLGWLAQFSLPTDGTADFTDGDHDGFNNYQEYRCGTDPTNALSFLCLLSPTPAGVDVTLTWPSGTGRSYFLEWSTDLSATPAFLPLATNLPGQPGTTTFTHTNSAGLGPCFYRVAVP